MNEAIRELFLNDWVKEATNEEIVSKLIENDNRAKEIERLHSIIKEVREYITAIKAEELQYTIGWIKLDLLEILDKVEEKK